MLSQRLTARRIQTSSTIEELVDKVQGEQGKVAGEVVHQHDAAMRSWSISRSAREKLGGLLCVNPACAKK